MTPEGWRDYVLAEVVAGRKGIQTGPFGSELHASDYAPSGVPVLMPRDLSGGVIRTAGVARIAPEKAADLARYRVLPGDVLFARRGDVGRCALVRSAEEGWLCGTGCLRVRLVAGINPEFIIQLLRWRPTIDWLRDHAVGQTMLHLNAEILSRLPVKLPPLPEQRRIAAVLASADEAIASIRAVFAQSRRVEEGYLRDLLRRGVGDGYGRRPEATAETSAHWPVRTIGELCSLSNGHRFKASDWCDVGLPILRIQNLNGSREFKYFAGYAKPNWIVEPGELLFAWAGMKGASFGPCIWPGPRGVLNQHIFRVRPAEGISKVWLYETLRGLTRRIEEKAHGFKASLLHVRKADVTGLRVAVPPYEEQRAIAARSRELSALRALEEPALERWRSLRAGLRNDLLSGRVRVTEEHALARRALAGRRPESAYPPPLPTGLGRTPAS